METAVNKPIRVLYCCLWGVALVALLLLMVGSANHLQDTFAWVFAGQLAGFLAFTVVGLQIALVALSLVNKAEERPQVRYALRLLMVLLLLLEVTGNVAAGGVVAMDQLPGTVAQLFYLPQDMTVRLAAILYAGFIPVLNIILTFAIVEGPVPWLLDERRNDAAMSEAPWLRDELFAGNGHTKA